MENSIQTLVRRWKGREGRGGDGVITYIFFYHAYWRGGDGVDHVLCVEISMNWIYAYIMHISCS